MDSKQCADMQGTTIVFIGVLESSQCCYWWGLLVCMPVSI